MRPEPNLIIGLLGLIVGTLSLLATYGATPLATALLGSFLLGALIGTIAVRLTAGTP